MTITSISQLDIVKNQILNLYLIQEKISIINDVKVFKMGDKEIGERTGKFTQVTYPDLYKELLLNEKYHLLINDESVISFYYLFDENKKIKKHNLSFIPSLDMDVYLADEISLNDRILILQNTNNYLRIDYDSKGKKDIVHTDVHMHYGIFHTEYEKDYSELRIPFEGVLYPYEFIYIILKYIYEVENEVLDFLLEEKYNKDSFLEQSELDKLVLTFNRESYKTEGN